MYCVLLGVWKVIGGKTPVAGRNAFFLLKKSYGSSVIFSLNFSKG